MRLSVIDPDYTRRQLLRQGFMGLGLIVVGPTIMGCGDDDRATAGTVAGMPTRMSNIANLGPLGDADVNSLRLPVGFTSRIVARTGRPPLPGSAYTWHVAPDGGATFAAPDGGWIYVSNSEWPLPPFLGGAGALRFDAGGTLIDAYPILTGTMLNCAGGPTPWGTWLSCEEFPDGQVWECDPFGVQPAAVRPSLGRFQHEAVAVDPIRNQLYLTEDLRDGRFYRFTPNALRADGFADLSAGILEVARVARVAGGADEAVTWHRLSDPLATSVPTRLQVEDSTAFNGGEGIWYHQGIVYFSTKGDNRVWAYDIEDDRLTVLYDDDFFSDAELRGVDNVTVSAGGDVLVAEDGDDMQIVAIAPGGAVVPIVQVVGHPRSEVTGPAFDPSGTRLYFSSQRGPGGTAAQGITYEVSGPFFV